MKHFFSVCGFLALSLMGGLLLPPQAYCQGSETIFQDDFNRSTFGANWDAEIAWSIVQGKAYNNYDGTGSALTTTQSFAQTSYVIESQARPFVGGYYRQYQLFFGQQASEDYRYVVKYDPYLGNTLSLGRAEGNTFYPVSLDQVVMPLDPATWYSFRVEKYNNGLIQVYLNDGSGYGDVPVLEAIDTTYSTLGKFGWFISTETAGEDFFVEYISAKVPTQQKTEPEKPQPDEFIKQVEVANGKTYEVDKLQVGVVQYTDRPYTITSLPGYLQGASFVRTANNDKTVTTSNFLNAYIRGPAMAYIAYDPRATVLPTWLADWTKTDDVIGTTDPGSSYFEVYSRRLDYYDAYPYPLTLGGNLAASASGSNMNYLLIVTPQAETQQYEAEAATLSGAVAASNHPGYSGTGFADYINPTNDYVEWTVEIMYSGAYSLNFHYANGGSSERPLRLSIDNQGGYGNIFIPTTGSWSSWGTTTSGAIYLAAGTHTVRATAIGKSGPNIDYLLIAPSSQPATNALTQAPDNARTLVSEVALKHGSFPNTFADETWLYYELAQTTPVRLSVYDLQGKLVQALVSEPQQAKGYYEVPFRANNLKDGVYVYRLQTGANVQSGKLLLKR